MGIRGWCVRQRSLINSLFSKCNCGDCPRLSGRLVWQRLRGFLCIPTASVQCQQQGCRRKPHVNDVQAGVQQAGKAPVVEEAVYAGVQTSVESIGFEHFPSLQSGAAAFMHGAVRI